MPANDFLKWWSSGCLGSKHCSYSTNDYRISIFGSTHNNVVCLEFGTIPPKKQLITFFRSSLNVSHIRKAVANLVPHKIDILKKFIIDNNHKDVGFDIENLLLKFNRGYVL